MTKGSFSCKQSVIYGHRVNSCKQEPTMEVRAATGPSFLAAARLHFLSTHAKVFHTAISSVLIWVCSPPGLAKPFIILRAWNSTALSQVVVLNIHWPWLLPFHQIRGRYSICGSAICRTLCSHNTGVKAKGKCHLTRLICHTVTALIEWWQRGPLLFPGGSTAFGLLEGAVFGQDQRIF